MFKAIKWIIASISGAILIIFPFLHISSEFIALGFYVIGVFAIAILFVGAISNLREKPALLILVSILLITALGLFIVILGENNNAIFKKLLGDETKQQSVEFVAYGIIGILAVINAVVVNNRTRAQEKKNDDYRFQHLVNDLGHKRATVRVASFNRFYYLASKNKGKNAKELSKNVFEILCSYLRVMSSETPYISKEKYEHLTESQILFDILFKGKFKFKPRNNMKPGLIYNEVTADLRNIHFADIDFSDANLSRVDFRKAQFINVNLKAVYCVKYADFRGATINGAPISINDFPEGAACYTDDNNP